ncbi:hypothetical protein N9580_01485 [Flavobacteriales bacterium]|jgi:hypothetical protein|nr:hypothetical protein [Flavobacteriales bacterium]
MAEKKQSSFEKVGYTKQLPTNAEISDYESILVKTNDGKFTKLYHKIVKKRKFDDTTNFSESWNVFNSLL